MVKFSRELEAQLIPEWKDAFVNYRQLKKQVKKIKISLHQRLDPDAAAAGDEEIPSFGISIFDGFRALAAGFTSTSKRDHRDLSITCDDDSAEEVEPVQSTEVEEKSFFNKLEKELEKVNKFYETKEREFCERGEALNKQLQILLDLKKILDEHFRRRQHRRCSSPNRTSETDVPVSDSSTSPAISEEVISALEKNGISFVGSARSKAKKGAKPKAATMRIDIPATTPGKTISAITSMVWEDLVNGARKEGECGGDYISRKKIQCAEKMIRGAFIELYRGLGLLKNYSSLNMIAFTKILKKYDKVSKKQASSGYLKKVKRSHFVNSDKVVKLVDEVETIFIKCFASNDKKKAMKFLRPNQPKESHMITFFVGLFTGSFVTLFTVYAFLAHISGIFSSTFEPGYMETVYPVFRRYMEEGYDPNHLANAGKYISAMLAAAVRWKYAFDPTPMWLAFVVITSTFATFYQLYWDFVKDWGLLNLYSTNLFLRDELILRNNSIYYVSMALNFVLRLAWIEAVLRLNLGPVENRLVDFSLASLEIIRRGHWNFYRLENEHLNNVGKFRAVKAVPLPFRDIE
ncbi:Phosphate transporter PHO1 [Dendrobium catenatum]|uniref:Phosphate transporter PHO1 n=1 Tax=Dendrobium catenatum TaxID=906689 RepID=A0A2I0XH22_9ASPA|nr:Phosphate transporter PHO1 [Dendrobium catenatum]